MTRPAVAQEPSKALIIAAFAALYTIWGSTYLANYFAIQSIPPFVMAGIRFTAAGVILFFWCLIQGQKTPPLSTIGRSSLAGILMLAIGTGAVIWVEQYLPSGLTAVIVATVPLWFVALDRREWSFYFSNKGVVLGLLIGFCGVLLLFAGGGNVNFTGNRMQLISFFVILGGSVCWAIGSLYSKYAPTEGDTTMKAAIQMLAAGLTSFLIAIVNGELLHFPWQQVTRSSFIAIVYLVTFGSLVGYISYIWLLSVRPPSLVGTYAYVNPVVAVFLGWLLAKEKIGTIQIMALVVILAGVIMVNVSKIKKKLSANG
jgi:drug/metabolite transporter (DMT)-like permease